MCLMEGTRFGEKGYPFYGATTANNENYARLLVCVNAGVWCGAWRRRGDEVGPRPFRTQRSSADDTGIRRHGASVDGQLF